MQPNWLSIITITKDDPVGLARTLGSTAIWRHKAGVQQLVVYSGVKPMVEVGQALRLHAQESTGIAAAFNEGLALVRSQWVWFLNGGDAVHEELDPSWLLALLANSRADLVVGGIHYDGDLSPRPVPSLSHQWPLLECWLPHPATLVKRQILLQAGGFDTGFTIAMDYDLWFRLLKGGATMDVISVPLARFDPRGLSQRADCRHVVRREEARLILRNWRSLLGGLLRLAGRTFRRLLWSVRHRTSNSQPPPTHG